MLNMLAQRQAELINLNNQLNKDLPRFPSGMLCASINKGRSQYYVRNNPSERCGTYIKKSNRDFAQKLAQKEYYNSVQIAVRSELELLENMTKFYENNNFEKSLERMNPLKMNLVEPLEKSDEEYIQEWLSQTYEKVSYFEETARFDNGKGIMMRSKSEVLISKTLDELMIPYKYEKPLVLANGRHILPDFTILDVLNRCEKYIEHFGMMDNPEYANNAIKKIHEYERNGIFIGQNLITVYETIDTPLDITIVKNLLTNYKM